MTEYDLLSNDWQRVQLLHGEHLSTETRYLEQMARWGLQYGRAWGVVHLGEGDLSVNGSDQDYAVSLRACKAITRRGYIVDVSLESEPIRLQGSNYDQPDRLVPLYIGVCRDKEAFAAGASQSGALDQRY